MKKLWLITALLVTRITSVAAFDITITAEKQVEVYQTEKKVVAIGNAVATKPGMEIKGEQLTAFFDKTEAGVNKGKTSITDMNAEGNAILNLPKANAFGDTMEYHVKDDYMLIKGNPARIKNAKATISATESITYYPGKEKAIARGNVVADNGKNKVYSDVMETYFENDKQGNPILNRVEIPQNVKIITKDGNVRAKTGVYYPDQGIVKLFENVVITQNGNVLKGDKAETNLNTGITKVLSGNKSRVSGTWRDEDI